MDGNVERVNNKCVIGKLHQNNTKKTKLKPHSKLPDKVFSRGFKRLDNFLLQWNTDFGISVKKVFKYSNSDKYRHKGLYEFHISTVIHFFFWEPGG